VEHLKKAAVARLCLNGDIYRAMPEVCDQYLPRAPSYSVLPLVPARYVQAEASEEQPHTIRDIWLVQEAKGKNRLCNEYDVTRQRCRVWAHTVHQSASKKKSKPKGEPPHTAAPPAPTTVVAETEKKEKSQ
jgi:hypothetical protein